MINPARRTLPAEAQVERSYAEMVDEGSVVRPGSESTDAHVRPFTDFLPLLLLPCLPQPIIAQRLVDRLAGHRVWNIAGHFMDKPFEGVGAGSRQSSLPVAVAVDINDGLRLQLVGVLLRPLGGAEQALLFPVPSGQNDAPLRPPALLEELAKCACLLQDCDHAAYGMGGAVDPRIMMVALDDPFIGKSAPLYARDDVIRGVKIPVAGNLEVHQRRSGAQVIGRRESAAPRFRSYRAPDIPKNRQGISPADGHDRYLRNRRGLLYRQAFSLWNRSNTRCERVTRVNGHIRNTAALHTMFRAVGAFRIDRPLVIPVVLGVGINQASDGSILMGNLRLDPAPALPVARQNYLSSHVYAGLLQRLVVARHSVVDVYDLRRDIPVDRVGIVSGKLIGIRRIRIFKDNGFLELRRVPLRPKELEMPFLRRREQHAEFLDRRI